MEVLFRKVMIFGYDAPNLFLWYELKPEEWSNTQIDTWNYMWYTKVAAYFFRSQITSKLIKLFSYNSIRLAMFHRPIAYIVYTQATQYTFAHTQTYSFERDGTFQTNEEHCNMYKCHRILICRRFKSLEWHA